MLLLDANLMAGGWGYIIRDWDGNVFAAGQGQIDHLLDAFQAEIIACVRGVQRAIELGIGNVVIVEIDALRVQQAAMSENGDDSAIGGLVRVLVFLLEGNFISVKLDFVPRTCNKVAMSL